MSEMKGLDKSYILNCLERHETIKGVTFEFAGFLDFENREYKYVVFEDCIFNDRVSFSALSNCLEFSFSNCQFNEVAHFEKLKNINKVEFLDCTFKRSVIVEDVNDPEIAIYVNKCNLSLGSISEFLNLKLRGLYFYECDLSGFTLKNSDVDYFEIEDSSVKHSLDIINLKSDSTVIKNKLPEKKISSIRLNSSLLDEFEIDSVSEIENLKLFNFKAAEVNCSVNNINLYTGDFVQLSLGVTTLDDSKQNSRIVKFSVCNIYQRGIIRIDKMYISNFNLQDVDASNATYYLSETVLMDTSIDGCIFSRFYCNQLFFINNPEIIRSDVSSFVTNNLGWGSGMKLKYSEDFKKIPLFYLWRRKKLYNRDDRFNTDELVLLRYHKDTYRQLKKASASNNNTIDMLQFYANEMQAYWKEIRLTGGISIWDRILIFLNRWTSNFGQSWINPLIGLFGFHLIFFSCILNWNYFGNSWTGDIEFGQFWVLLNPVHKTPEYINTGAGLFTEFAMRVVGGYFIYHFIKATRKFGKV